MIPGAPNDRRHLSPAETLTSLEELARRFGPPPYESAEDRQRRLAQEDAAATRADLRKLDRYFDGQALDRRDDRIVRGYLGGGAA